MPTIFIKNLKLLVAGQLKLRWSGLKGQETAYDFGFVRLSSFVHDTTLSTEQADIIGRLETKITTFKGTGNDEEDKNTIKSLIASFKTEVENAREDHNAGASSDTLTCLEDISNAIENFYMQLQVLTPNPLLPATTPKFALLNLMDRATPEYIVYSHACFYLGLAKFYPDSHCSIETRKLKENALLTRLDFLKKTIRPEHTLEEQRAFALKELTELSRDNADIVKPKKALSIPLISAGLSLFSMPVKAQTASVGTLEKAITLATKEITAMTISTSAWAKPVLSSVGARDLSEDEVPKPKPAVKLLSGGSLKPREEEERPPIVGKKASLESAKPKVVRPEEERPVLVVKKAAANAKPVDEEEDLVVEPPALRSSLGGDDEEDHYDEDAHHEDEDDSSPSRRASF